MIKYKKAPAGFIAQYCTDDKRAYAGAPNQNYRDNHYMGVTGEWCPTLDEAIKSVKKQLPREVKKLQKKVERLKAQVAAYEAMVKDLEGTSDKLVVSK